MCQRPDRSRVTRWDFTAAGMSRVQRNRTHPTFRHPHLPAAAAQPLNVACFDADLVESLVLTGLAPRRTTVGAVQKVAHRLGEIAQRLLLHRLRSSGQPLVFGARSGQLGALLVVARGVAAVLPVLLLDG